MPKRTYTKAVHVKRLERILELDTCQTCPGAYRYLPYRGDRMFEMWSNLPCSVCREFVGISVAKCPCRYFGDVKAIELSRIALAEYYKNKK